MNVWEDGKSVIKEGSMSIREGNEDTREVGKNKVR